MSEPEVLVVGAGPSGLTAACTLLRFGISCRIVDQRPAAGQEPKALVLWSGALEALRRTEVTDELVADALPLAGASYWARRRQITAVRFGELACTAFPRPVCLPQPHVETLLHKRLVALGGSVEWGVEARSAYTGADGVTIRLHHGDGRTERLTVPWVIGADGVRSAIRTWLGIPFQGRTYERTFLLGDGELAGPAPADMAQYHLSPDGVLVVVPLPGGGHRVFFDTAPDDRTDAPDEAELQALLDARGPGTLRLTRTFWTSRFRVHTKVAAQFRIGRVFLAGDAAHCHSPAGGQGLNTGVQDGYDIGWRLAAVLRGADAVVLDGYEAERRPAAQRAVRNADRQTRLWLVRSPVGQFVRDTALRVLSRRGVLEKRFVPQLAQLDHDYATSPAVLDMLGAAGPAVARVGRRMPDCHLRPVVGTDATSLHDYLAAGRHVLIAFGADTRSASDLAVAVAERGAAVDVLCITPGPGQGGVAVPYAVAEEPAGVLSGGDSWLGYVRPDGVLGGRAGVGQFDRLLTLVPARN
jgi:2-polyprenyl-6-methoxyphenol hydroxylase-like FAD-dependent oxidoreductase